MKAKDPIGHKPPLWRATPHNSFYEQACWKTVCAHGDD